jgi:pyruvate,water dikinase
MAARLQALAGRPVDVEWAIRRSHLYVLQCRPVTTCRVDNITGEWTTADFKDGGVSSTVCTPFMWSLYDRVWEATLPVHLRRVGLLARDTSVAWARMFFARPYWNVGAVKEALKRVPGFVERDFDDDLGIAVTYEGSGFRSPTTLRTILRGLLVLWQLRRSFKRQLLYCHRFVPTQRRRLDELDGLDVRAWSDERLFTFYRGFIDREYFRSEASYFHLIYDTSNANTLFHQQLQKLQTGVPLTDLIGGLTNLSHLRESRSLMVLVGAIRRNRLWNDYWTHTSVADIAAAWNDGREDHGMSLIRGHIDAFKHHATRQLDLQVPRYADDPTPVFSTIKQVLVSEIDHDPEEHALRRQHTADCARRSLLAALPRHQRRRLGRRLTQLRTFLWMREELRDLSTHYYYHVRRFTLAVAHRLIARGLLKRSGDVFFLPIREILSATEGLRTVTQLADTVAKRRRYYDGFRHFDNPNEIGRRYGDVPASTVDAGALRGIGCSPGVVDARVKIIRDITETERLEEGDILVTEFTDPGWTVTFGLLSAVVTETGGTLSHAAVIAREYGIPAVLAVPKATTRLRDGQLVRVDGSAGTITVLDDSPGDTLADDGHDVTTMRSAELVT